MSVIAIVGQDRGGSLRLPLIPSFRTTMWIASVIVCPCSKLFGQECVGTRRFLPKQTKLIFAPLLQPETEMAEPAIDAGSAIPDSKSLAPQTGN
jgi:hypothetical protein